MLTIRAAQMQVFEDDLLIGWIAAWLREAHPLEIAALREGELRELVTDAVARGRAFGLRLPEDLRAYARVRLLLGGDPRTGPGLAWAREFLDDWDPDLGGRVGRLEREILNRRAAGASRP